MTGEHAEIYFVTSKILTNHAPLYSGHENITVEDYFDL